MAPLKMTLSLRILIMLLFRQSQFLVDVIQKFSLEYTKGCAEHLLLVGGDNKPGFEIENHLGVGRSAEVNPHNSMPLTRVLRTEKIQPAIAIFRKNIKAIRDNDPLRHVDRGNPNPLLFQQFYHRL